VKIRLARPRMNKATLSCSWLALALFLSGCQTISYYTQAVSGQMQILNRKRSIKSVLNDPTTSDALKQKLQLVLTVREFAEKELHLPANGHYLDYADLGRPFAVWNVYAAPEFSLTPKSWWYPAVGRLEYRGYFSEKRAREYAAELEKEGYDVYVGGVTAYSTLGWFEDPVLNTFVWDDDYDLAEVLFHELAHQRLFVPGDTDFNEAFATAVAEEGLRRWMQSRNDSSANPRIEASFERTEQFVNLVAQTRAKLDALYATPNGEAEETQRAMKRREKQRILEGMRSEYQRLRMAWSGDRNYDHWFSRRLNNAQLNTVQTYHQLVPAFRTLLEDHHGDLESFYKTVQDIAKLKKEERHLRLGRMGDTTGRKMFNGATASAQRE
jgi:predicted aminopeptidase